MFTAKQITVGILILLALVVIIQNSYTVRIQFLLFSWGMPLSLLLFLVLLIGALAGIWLVRRRPGAKK